MKPKYLLFECILLFCFVDDDDDADFVNFTFFPNAFLLRSAFFCLYFAVFVYDGMCFVIWNATLVSFIGHCCMIVF